MLERLRFTLVRVACASCAQCLLSVAAVAPDGKQVKFLVYHKTGCTLSLSILSHLGRSGLTKSELNPAGVNVSYHVEPELIKVNVEWQLSGPPRMIHMIRDPVELIISGYRFHVGAPNMYSEPWLRIPIYLAREKKGVKVKGWPKLVLASRVPDHLPDIYSGTRDKANAMIFEGSYSVRTLYQHLKEEEAIIFEAYLWSEMMETMLTNYELTSTDDLTLQVPMEHVQAYFTQTLVCIFDFMQQSASLDKEKIEHIIFANNPANGGDTFHHGSHGKYDNRHLAKILHQDPMMHKLYDRYHSIMARSTAKHC